MPSRARHFLLLLVGCAPGAAAAFRRFPLWTVALAAAWRTGFIRLRANFLRVRPRSQLSHRPQPRLRLPGTAGPGGRDSRPVLSSPLIGLGESFPPITAAASLSTIPQPRICRRSMPICHRGPAWSAASWTIGPGSRAAGIATLTHQRPIVTSSRTYQKATMEVTGVAREGGKVKVLELVKKQQQYWYLCISSNPAGQ